MTTQTCSPLTRKKLVDLYFLEMRAKLIDIAAFLDRLDRAQDAQTAAREFRVDALRQAFQELTSDAPGRTARIQMRLSDPTADPIPDAMGLKGATGAYAPECYTPRREA